MCNLCSLACVEDVLCPSCETFRHKHDIFRRGTVVDDGLVRIRQQGCLCSTVQNMHPGVRNSQPEIGGHGAGVCLQDTENGGPVQIPRLDLLPIQALALVC
eukprot:Lithocolla_globosa_v1_NODE_1232_length_2753_cov_6.257969.p6 type:complete len:101 gc:universal NODE_1232_length_2753_cov_6.257969:461-763(+)